MDKDKEELKKELLDELKKEYKLIPIKEAPLNVSDILDKYYDDISIKIDVPLDWNAKQGIAQAIRKVVCMHFGYAQMKYVPQTMKNDFRLEFEKFIKEYILGGK